MCLKKSVIVCRKRGRFGREARAMKAQNSQIWCNKHFQQELVGSENLVDCAKTNRPVVAKEELLDTTAQCQVNVGHAGRGSRPG